jgi:hypothetical protein
MRVLFVPAALLVFVIVSLISQAIAFTQVEKTVMFGGGMLLVGAFIILAFK